MKSKAVKGKVDKLDSQNKKPFSERQHWEIKRQETNWKNIFAIHISDKGLVFKICKEFLQPNNKNTTRTQMIWLKIGQKSLDASSKNKWNASTWKGG